MRTLVTVSLVSLLAPIAFGDIVISEWMYNGLGEGEVGEFVEFTNIGPNPVDFTGWSFDDSSRVPGSEVLSGFGVVAPGQSVIFTDDTAAAFTTAWGLSGVSVIGGNTNNLGRSDEVNLYDADGNLVDRLTYNDQTGQGPRTRYLSCNIPAADYGYTVAQGTWVLAGVGDAYGSWMSARNEIGSPGQVPEPATMALLAATGVLMVRRCR